MRSRKGGDANQQKSILFNDLRQELGFVGASGLEAAKPEPGDFYVVTLTTPTGRTEFRWPCSADGRGRS